jgi:CheY-like chemotaxis protein
MKDRSIPPAIRQSATILVVEDNLLNQKLDSYILDSWGLKHHICSNGRHAVEILRNTRFSAVLMDIRMPELNGYEATKIIRNELNLQVPIIGITAHASEEEKMRCLSEGMNNYISKPVDEDELFSLLMACLENSEQTVTQTGNAV